MRKIVVSRTGAPEVLELVVEQTPPVGPDQVLVEVEAAGINFIDVYQRTGSLEIPRPFVPGFEGVGRVLEVGANAGDVKAGDRIAWINVMGSYAEMALIPANQVIRIPENFEVAEALLFQPITAQYLLSEYRTVRSGDVVLVHAAAGGVGQVLVQWLKHLGATVIGTASTTEKLFTIRTLGADYAVDYSNGFLEQVLSLTGGRGVDLALDAVGASTFESTVKALAPRGMAISYGHASGRAPAIELLPLVLKGARVGGASLFEYIRDPKEMQRRAADVIRAVQEGWLRPPAVKQFAIHDVVAAHRTIEGRSSQGKLALVSAA